MCSFYIDVNISAKWHLSVENNCLFFSLLLSFMLSVSVLEDSGTYVQLL